MSRVDRVRMVAVALVVASVAVVLGVWSGGVSW